MKPTEFYRDRYAFGADLDEQRPRIEALVKLARGLTARRLLALGCGDGSMSLLLKQATGAIDVLGVDISPEAIKAVCQKRNKWDSPERR